MFISFYNRLPAHFSILVWFSLHLSKSVVFLVIFILIFSSVSLFFLPLKSLHAKNNTKKTSKFAKVLNSLDKVHLKGVALSRQNTEI